MINGLGIIKKQACFIALFLLSLLFFTSASSQESHLPLHAYLHNGWPAITPNTTTLGWRILPNKTVVAVHAEKVEGTDKLIVKLYALKEKESEAINFFNLTIDSPRASLKIDNTDDKVFILYHDNTYTTLLVTDGTIGGTNELYKTKHSIGLTDDTVYRNLYFSGQSEGEVFIQVFEHWVVRDYNSNISLLRSNGSVSGTSVVSLPSLIPPTNIFILNDSTYFFHEQRQLHKVAANDNVELIHEYDWLPSQDGNGGGVSPIEGNVITTNQGSFHCSQNSRPLDSPYHEGLVWKITNNDIVGSIAVGCISGSLFNVGDRIFYQNDNGLWFTDGTLEGEQLIYSYPSKGWLYGWSGSRCLINDDIYLTLTKATNNSVEKENRIVKISPDNSVSLVHQNLRTIAGCTDNGLVLAWDVQHTSNPTFLKQRFYLDLEDNNVTTLNGFQNDSYNSIKVVKRAPTAASETLSLVTGQRLESYTPSYRHFGIRYAPYSPYYLSSYYKDTYTPLPHLMLLLDED